MLIGVGFAQKKHGKRWPGVSSVWLAGLAIDLFIWNNNNNNNNNI
jgi:hypothetical protein